MSIDNALMRLANAVVSIVGNGFNPEGSALPAFRSRIPPRVELPERPKKPTVAVGNDSMYTDDEIDAMTDVEFAIKVGGAKSKADFYSTKSETRKSNEIDFDTVDNDTHGITPREYGEMRAYTPTLLNLELAGKVKRGKQAGKSLRKIAQEIGQTYQTVRHYSAALGRAKE